MAMTTEMAVALAMVVDEVSSDEKEDKKDEEYEDKERG